MADPLPGGAMRGAPRSALVVGGTGLVGRHLVALLAADARYRRVIVAGRRPLPRPPLSVEQVLVDFDALDSHRHALAADHVFCALGTTRRDAGSKEAFRRVDLEYPVRVAELARAGGAVHFALVSALGADPGSRVFYTRVKGEAEAAVRAVGYPGGTIVRPSILGGSHEGRPLERIAQVVGRRLPRRWKRVEAADVARAMIEGAGGERSGWRIIENPEIFDLAERYRLR